MANILMISYFFPPDPEIGAVRPAKFARYLFRFGWRPVVLTAEKGGGAPRPEIRSAPFPVVSSPARDIPEMIRRYLPAGGRGQPTPSPASGRRAEPDNKNRFRKVIRELAFFPDRALGWYPSAVRAGLDCLRRYDIDLIWSTSNPPTAHLVGKTLKNRTGLPWVADLRDLWSQDVFEWFREKSTLRQKLDRLLDRRTLSRADALITISEPLGEDLRRFHPEKRDRVFVITNGFDPDDFPAGEKRGAGPFAITHTGSLYGGGRDPSPLLAAAASLLGEGTIDPARFRIRFLGDDRSPLDLAARFGLGGVVEVDGPVPREAALRAQAAADVLLVIQYNPRARPGAYTGKLFEYLGARRPILALAPPGSVIGRLLEKTGAGAAALEAEDLKALVGNWYREYARHGEVRFRGIGEEIEKFSYQNKAGELAGVLDRVAAAGGGFPR